MPYLLNSKYVVDISGDEVYETTPPNGLSIRGGFYGGSETVPISLLGWLQKEEDAGFDDTTGREINRFTVAPAIVTRVPK